MDELTKMDLAHKSKDVADLWIPKRARESAKVLLERSQNVLLRDGMDKIKKGAELQKNSEYLAALMRILPLELPPDAEKGLHLLVSAFINEEFERYGKGLHPTTEG